MEVLPVFQSSWIDYLGSCWVRNVLSKYPWPQRMVRLIGSEFGFYKTEPRTTIWTVRIGLDQIPFSVWSCGQNIHMRSICNSFHELFGNFRAESAEVFGYLVRWHLLRGPQKVGRGNVRKLDPLDCMRRTDLVAWLNAYSSFNHRRSTRPHNSLRSHRYTVRILILLLNANFISVQPIAGVVSQQVEKR